MTSWKICICSIAKIVCSWKNCICSVNKHTLLEKWYLFDEQLYLPGKLVSVSVKTKPPGKIQKKVLRPGSKEQIFSKIVSVSLNYINLPTTSLLLTQENKLTQRFGNTALMLF